MVVKLRGAGSTRGWTLLVVLAAGLASSATTCSRTAVMEQPGLVSFSERSEGAVRGAILGALANRGWTSAVEEPGRIRGAYEAKGRQATIRVSYTRNSYELEYVDSRNLNHSTKARGDEQIDARYNAWIKGLRADIDTLLAGGRLTPAGASLAARATDEKSAAGGAAAGPVSAPATGKIILPEAELVVTPPIPPSAAPPRKPAAASARSRDVTFPDEVLTKRTTLEKLRELKRLHDEEKLADADYEEMRDAIVRNVNTGKREATPSR